MTVLEMKDEGHYFTTSAVRGRRLFWRPECTRWSARSGLLTRLPHSTEQHLQEGGLQRVGQHEACGTSESLPPPLGEGSRGFHQDLLSISMPSPSGRSPGTLSCVIVGGDRGPHFPAYSDDAVAAARSYRYTISSVDVPGNKSAR